jgi:hypothetical protein
LGIFPVWLTCCGELGAVITCDTGIVHKELDSFWFLVTDLSVETLYIFWVAVSTRSALFNLMLEM